MFHNRPPAPPPLDRLDVTWGQRFERIYHYTAHYTIHPTATARATPLTEFK